MGSGLLAAGNSENGKQTPLGPPSANTLERASHYLAHDLERDSRVNSISGFELAPRTPRTVEWPSPRTSCFAPPERGATSL